MSLVTFDTYYGRLKTPTARPPCVARASEVQTAFGTQELKSGALTCIDIDEICCRQLRECLINEKNPNMVTIIHSDVISVDGFDNQFAIVTMVGSTRMESGHYQSMLEKAFSFLKNGGSLYYQTLDRAETGENMVALCEKNNMNIDNYLLDANYGFRAQYWKITKIAD